jgi:hypothetical protein
MAQCLGVASLHVDRCCLVTGLGMHGIVCLPACSDM